MNGQFPPLILLGIGTAGCAIARGVTRAFGEGIRHLLVDTDASTGDLEGPFTLLGGDRLSGRGSGGDSVAARLAAEESVGLLDESLEGARLAVVVTSLGGGTGNGATLETVRHISHLGIPSIVFATLPFAFEGDDRMRSAQSFLSMIEDVANATFPISLDTLVKGDLSMDEAFRRAVDTMASGVTLFWRLLQKPGYIRLDTERIRLRVGKACLGRFAAVSAQGPDRARRAVEQLVSSDLLGGNATPTRAILCGVLAGDDLRLAEVAEISDGIRATFGPNLPFDLGTVNDEGTFSGRLSVVLLLFSADETTESVEPNATDPHRGRKGRGVLGVGPTGRGRFNNAEPSVWHDEDLDAPTYVRRNITLEF